MPENRVLRRLFGSKCEEETRGWEKNYIMSFIICTLPVIVNVCM
jgi:hypothetical protein